MSTQNPTLSRRTLLKTGAGAVAGGTLATGVGTDRSFVGESDAAIGTAILLGGTALAAGGTGVLLREYEIIGSDDPPEGVTPDTLKQQVYSTAKKRKSVNQTTFVDNENILNYMPEAAFSEAKTAALEALNEQKTKDEVQAAGEEVANTHFVTVEKNLLKSWNESVSEYDNFVSTLSSHSDTGPGSIINWQVELGSNGASKDGYAKYRTTTNTVALADNSSFEIKQIKARQAFNGEEGRTSDGAGSWGPTSKSGLSISNTGGHLGDILPFVEINHNGESFTYLNHNKWVAVWNKIQDTESQIMSDLSQWVDNIYDQVQAGEIDTSQLISGVDLANMTDDSVPQAVADLAALNIPADLDNQATVELDDGTIMAGFLAFTDSTATDGLASGDSLDPSAVSGDVYMAHDLAEWSVPWTDWDSNKGIDGGLLHLTADPTVVDGQPVDDPSTLIYTIETTAGETVAVSASDFSKTTNDSGTTVWEIDLSSKLENQITSVDSITVTLDTKSRYATQQINQPFTVTQTQSGDPVSPGQSREPQSDDNYITQDEWDELLKQQEELIKEYEEAKAGGGGFSLPSFSQIPENAWMWLVSGIAALAGINAATS